MKGDDYEMVFRLLAALAAGALIDCERSYHVRPAGFRVRRHNMVIRSADRSGAGQLAVTVEKTDSVLELRITPTGD